MYYKSGGAPHGLPHDSFRSSVISRPSGWISAAEELPHGADEFECAVLVKPPSHK